MRTSGIPTVVDRLIQQAIAQQLSAIVDKSFSDSSYGFRPGHSVTYGAANGGWWVWIWRSSFDGTVAKLAMRQPFVLFKGLTFQKLCLP
ncbi:hypothetical protein MQC68_23115, partial [Escherichia coli]|nr:hypothetical protein [Escherichia coli]MCI3461662.1 hypothetical protein [Escherichia coli]